MMRDLRIRFTPPRRLPDLGIRAVTAADLAALEWEGEFAHFRKLFADTFADMQKGRRLMLVAERQRYLLGQVFIQFRSQAAMLADGRSRGYLYAFRVRPSYQNMGIGTALLDAAENVLLKYGYEYGVLAVAKDNPGALRLYERNGYIVIGEDAGEWSYIDQFGRSQQVSEPCWVLEKRLPQMALPGQQFLGSR